MAHVSGYEGSLVLGTAGDTEFGPSATTVKVESWTIRQTVDSFTAMAKGDAWKTKFMTAADWTATCTFLLQTTMVSTELDIRKDTTAPKAMTALDFVTATGDKFEGTGWVSRVEIDDPVDGPAKVTVEIEGDGPLTSTGAS